MILAWTSPAIGDLERLHGFLAQMYPRSADNVVLRLTIGAEKLLEHPRIGERVDSMADVDVRRLMIGDYELRYDVVGQTIRVLRIWHHRENR